jgi:hypothetical protein
MGTKRTAGRPGARRRTQIGGQFAARLIEMLEAPAYRVLNRVLSRLEIDFAHHGLMDDGCPAGTYEDFERYGIDRHAISPAIREVEALGFIEITEQGRAGTAWWRKGDVSKAPRGILTPVQRNIHEALRAAGAVPDVAHGLDAAIELLERWVFCEAFRDNAEAGRLTANPGAAPHHP